MGKFILGFLIAFGASVAGAGEIACELNGMYSRMKVDWDDAGVTVHVTNPRGFDWMPQMEAPFALRDLGLLKTQSEQLKGLGSEFEYTWKRENCELSPSNPWLVSCHARVSSNGTDNGVKAALFTTAQIDETSLSGNQSTLRLRFIFDNAGMYFVAIPFPMPFCAVKP